MTRTRTVTSKDGTRIGFSEEGSGPGILIVTGINRMAHHYAKLAGLLAADHTVYVLERRGRGISGPQGADYGIEKEIEDVQAILGDTGASTVFGHSYGGLIALHAAIADPRITRVAVYEPGVSLDGSFDVSWGPRLTVELDQRRFVRAMTLFLTMTNILPFRMPHGLVPLLSMLLLSGKGGAELRALMTNMPKEIGEIGRLDSDGAPYSRIRASALLLGGSKSPSYLTGVLPRINALIPVSECEIIAGLDHNAPDLTAPEILSSRLRRFAGASALR